MRTIKYADAMKILGWIYTKNGLPYHYGGSGNPGGDCSWFVMAVAAALQGKPQNQRYGSTETFRTATGEVLGLVKASSKQAVPHDAILKVGFKHGGGGYYSHTSGTFAGVNFESRGMYKGVSGHVVGGTARAWDDPLYHQWWYTPARLGARSTSEFPLPPGWYYGPLSGPDQSVSGMAGEPAYQVEGLKQLQRILGLPPTGKWPDAAGRVRQIQAQAGGALGPSTGHVGPKTWAHIINQNQPAPAPAAHSSALLIKEENTMLTLDTTVRSLVDGSTVEDRLGNFILHADRNSWDALQEIRALTRKVDQLTELVGSLQARAASGDDRAQE